MPQARTWTIAIGGYDVVAYFNEGTPRLGKQDHAVQWRNLTWQFTSEANAKEFLRNPEAFEPMFAGDCAVGATFGRAATASPSAWRIIDGRLYLMKDRAVRMLSHLFTGRIAAAADRWSGDGLPA